MADAEERARDFLADHGVLTCEDVAPLAALIRDVRRGEREACELAVCRALEPFGERPPCECARANDDEMGSWVAVCGRCTDTRRLVEAQDWCSRQNAVEIAAAAIRARGDGDG